MLLPPMPPGSFSVPKLPPPGSVRILCVCTSSDASQEVWPEYTAFPPRVGDRIQSELGMTLDIQEVVHSADMSGTPVVMLHLGQGRNSITPMEGAGSADSY